jgi:glycine dehydrogenase subunit 1
MPLSLHPAYRATVQSIVGPQDIEIISLPFETDSGRLSLGDLQDFDGEDITALIIAQPNFFGVLEEVDELTAWAKRNDVLVIAVTNPLTLALLNPPGEWGEGGADIVCGEGQPLGAPLCSGGPYFGFLCCNKNHVRQLPGRLVGRTVDADGKPGFVLTLQAREQHIRRSKATSNICTNQGLVVTAATIYMSLLGFEGLRRVAASCYSNTHALAQRLIRIEGVEPFYSGEFFHEIALRLNKPASLALEAMAEQGIAGGYPLDRGYPGLENGLLVCATETKTEQDMERYVSVFTEFMSR